MTRGDHDKDQPELDMLGFLRDYQKAFTRYLMTGLMVWVPLIITIWVLWFFIRSFIIGLEVGIAGVVIQLHQLADAYPRLYFLDFIQYRRGFGTLITAVLFVGTGLLTRFIVGQRIIATGERIVQRIPLISRIYRAVQQIRDTFVNREGAVFQKTVLVEYPRKGVWSVAFLTSREPKYVESYLEKKFVAVFMPTTPNVTTGFLLYLPAEDVVDIELGTEEALKMVLSCGAYLPEEALKELEEKRKALPEAGTAPVRPVQPEPAAEG
jgi:uncharacterized membrane protein